MSYSRMMFSTVAMVCALAGSAAAQVDEQAKAALLDAVKAIKEAPGLTFNSKRGTEGMAQMTMGGEGQVKLIRSATPSSTMAFAFKGKTDVVLEGTIQRDMMTDSKTVTWVDDKAQKIFESPMVQGAEGSGVVYRVREIMIMPPLRDEEPFASELKAGKIVMEAPAVIAGEQCQVVRAVIKEGQTDRVIYISALDRLPRRYEMVVYLQPGKGGDNGRMAMVYEMSDLKTDKIDLSKHTVGADKTSYKREKLNPTPPTAANPAPAPNPSIPNVISAEGGLKEGAALPSFNFDSTEKGAKGISNENLSGHPTVLGFFNTRVPSSMEIIDTLASVDGKDGVKTYAVAGRAEDGDAVSGAVAKRRMKSVKSEKGEKGEKNEKGEKGEKGAKGSSGPMVVMARDMSLDQMGIRGFPSMLVLNAEGRVVKYFDGVPTAEELADALKSARKK